MLKNSKFFYLLLFENSTILNGSLKSILESRYTNGFINNVKAAYQTSRLYYPAHDLQPVDGTSNPYFAETRGKTITRSLAEERHRYDTSTQAYLSEWFAYTCLHPSFKGTKFIADLAPETLERSFPGHKGTDLIISEMNDDVLIPIVSINMKLRKRKESRDDRHWFDRTLQSPSMNVSVGDWNITTRENETFNVKKWISNLVLTNIQTSGKVPYFEQYKEYILKTIRNTLGIYKVKFDEYTQGIYTPHGQDRRLFPSSSDEMDNLAYKLFTGYKLFDELVEYYC